MAWLHELDEYHVGQTSVYSVVGFAGRKLPGSTGVI